jgi:O-antigen ligase
MTASSPLIGRSLRVLLLLHAALLPVSIAAGQIWAYLVAVLFVAALFTRWREELLRAPLTPFIACFAVAVLFSVGVGVRPAQALAKADRLFLLAVPLMLPLFQKAWGVEGLRRLLIWFVAACSLKGLYDAVRIPLAYAQAREAFQSALSSGTLEAGALPPTLFEFGNMRDPQFYAVALCIALAFWIMRSPGAPRWFFAAAILLNSTALIMHFKRGAWLATLLAVILLGLLSRRSRVVFLLLLVAIGAAFLPPVQTRLRLIQEEFQIRTGGRYALWSTVAPALLREYPLGMGWRSVTHEDLLKHGVPVQKKLNHLHNNVLQVRLETGWLGLAAWLAWMGAVFVWLARGYRRACAEHSPWAGPALGVLTGFTALHFNGLVENNFGDGEVFMLMNLLMGIGVAGVMALRRPASG